MERFEFFMNGWEMANAYSELNDPIDQRERFAAQEEQFSQGDEEANQMCIRDRCKPLQVPVIESI